MPKTKAEWKKLLDGKIKDVFMNFFYYNRKEDEDLPVDKIEELVQAGIITKQEIKDMFMAHLDKNLP